jgi:hypothetical protein
MLIAMGMTETSWPGVYWRRCGRLYKARSGVGHAEGTGDVRQAFAGFTAL